MKKTMRTPEERRSDAQDTILAWLEPVLHKKVDWDSLPDDFRSRFEPYLEEMSHKPETRMRETMEAIAANVKLRWTPHSPPGHPYDAQLDGQLFNGSERIAVVELESRTPKQVRGALLVLMKYPRKTSS